MVQSARPTLSNPDHPIPMKTLTLALLLCLALCICEPSFAASASESPQTIKLERFRKALWTVRVTIDGTSGNFLFDTGGGQTLVTKEFAASLTCRFTGRATGYNMFGKRIDSPYCNDIAIKAGEVPLTNVSMGKIDFGDQFAGDKTPDGLLSLDAFDGKAITFDQAARTLTIETPGSLQLRTKTMTELPLRVSRECSARCLSVFLGVRRPIGMTWLVLDSGAGGVSLIAKEYAEAFGLDPNGKELRLKFDIVPGVTVDSPALVTDMIMDGNLGQPFMSQYLITFDLANSRMWIAQGSQSAK
jgi:hypothetical protein